MSQADEYNALVEELAYQHFLKYEGGSPEWSEAYWKGSKDAVHRGDCPYAEHRGPITCDRCVVDEHRVFARAVLAVIAEKAKEGPTEGMCIAWAKSEAWVSPDYAWRAMLAASPLIKPEDPK